MRGKRSRLCLALLMLPALTGCYLLQAARGQLELVAKRQPIAKLTQDSRTQPELRSQLERVLEIRAYATATLDLPDNDSYRSYADLGRPYVVWSVFAAPEFSVDPKTWCFPITGCVAYRGYFSETRARRYAKGLADRGFDTYVGGVPAYSTLGHFADPVLNTMLRWQEADLAAIIFHELAHQRVYLANDSSFNEAFATVVEFEGTRRWLLAQQRPEQLAAFQARRQRYFEFADLVAAARPRLRALYAESLPVATLRARKVAEFERLRADYAALKARWGVGAFDGFFGADLNNAALLSVATYHDCVPGLQALLEENGGDLPRYYAAVRALGKLSVAERQQRYCRPAARRSES
jgi:predicted aminopeptidase